MNDEGVQIELHECVFKIAHLFFFYAQSPDFHNRATASKFSKVVISIRSFLQILYHSITTKVVAINIQALDE